MSSRDSSEQFVDDDDSPATLIPVVFDVEERIRELEQCLDPNNSWYQRQEQHVNIRAVIQLYKKGKLPDPHTHETHFKKGKIISKEEVLACPINTWTESGNKAARWPEDDCEDLSDLFYEEEDGSDYSPVTLISVVFNVEERLKELRDGLNPESQFYERPEQHDNLRAVMKEYDKGHLDPTKGRSYWKGGVEISKDEAMKDLRDDWVESEEHVLMAEKEFYTAISPETSNRHVLKMHLRLPREYGGRNLIRRVRVLHDTGSSILTLYRSDVLPLGSDNYQGWGTIAGVTYGNGARERLRTLWVEVRFMKEDGTPWSNWFWERAVVRDAAPGMTRCSGAEM